MQPSSTPRGTTGLGLALTMARRAAVARFAGALRVGAEPAGAWHELGTALAALRDHAGAFTALKYALRIDCTRACTHRALGALLFDAGRLDDALECYARAITLEAGAPPDRAHPTHS